MAASIPLGITLDHLLHSPSPRPFGTHLEVIMKIRLGRGINKPGDKKRLDCASGHTLTGFLHQVGPSRDLLPTSPAITWEQKSPKKSSSRRVNSNGGALKALVLVGKGQFSAYKN